MKMKFCLFPLILTLLLIGCSKDPIDSNDGTFKDSRDKHVYKYVKVGTQIWMAENLAYMPAVSSSSDESVSSPFYYVYDYDGSSISEAKSIGNYSSYGVLYNWKAAKTACPSGWHLPSDAEWTMLGANSSDLNIQLGGYRFSGYSGGSFELLGNLAYFWSSTESGSLNALDRCLNPYIGGLYQSDDDRTYGFSVRCLKN